MQLRRRLNRAQPRVASPVTTIVTSVAVIAAAAFGGHAIMSTQDNGGGAIETSSASEGFGSGATVVVDDPAIATQGQGAGPRAVKEFRRDQPFSQFAVTWQGQKDVAAFVRAEQADGSWSEWYEAQPQDVVTDGTNGTDLIWVGTTNAVQVSVGNVDLGAPSEQDVADAGEKPNDAPSPSPLPSNYGDIKPVADVTNGAGATPGGISADELSAVFIDGNAQAGGIAPAAESVTAGMPKVVSRAGWGANEGIRCQQPDYDNGVKALTLHHTAGSNNYTQADAAAQVRGIYQYHAQQLGWCDIGYNALVDKFGTIYEGRFGGLDKAVQGAHVGGFNSNTWGISMIGNYETAQPTTALIDSVTSIAAWKAAVSGFDPAGQVSLRSGGFNGSRYPAGSVANVPAFHGHSDLHYTSCPGQYTIAQWPAIRSATKAKYEAIKAGGAIKPITPQQPQQPAPGGAPSVPTVQGSSIGGVEISGSQVQALATVAAAVATLAIGSGAVSVPKSGDEVAGGLTVGEIPGIVSKIIALSGDASLQQSWAQIMNTLGPVLGLPVGGPNSTETQIIYQLFQNGVVMQSKDTGVRTLIGEFAKAWAEGDNATKLGLPTTDQYNIGGRKVKVDFQGGSIVYNPDTSSVEVLTN